MNGIHEEWLEDICELHGLECKVDEDFGAVGDGGYEWLVEVRGMGGTEETAALLIEALRSRGGSGVSCCFGTDRIPGEDYFGSPSLNPCGDCLGGTDRDPAVSGIYASTPDSRAAELAFWRTLK
jgi:hypothetical protein